MNELSGSFQLIAPDMKLGKGVRHGYLKQQMPDELIKHKHRIDIYNQDLSEIRNWKWMEAENQ
jgi:phosphoketolase